VLVKKVVSYFFSVKLEAFSPWADSSCCQP
jgi:hypothetical protein